MTGMGRPKHFAPPSRWAITAFIALIIAGMVLADFAARVALDAQ